MYRALVDDAIASLDEDNRITVKDAAGLEAATRVLLGTHVAAWDRANGLADPSQRRAELARVRDAGAVATAVAAVVTVVAARFVLAPPKFWWKPVAGP
jgi:hypothetical protein